MEFVFMCCLIVLVFFIFPIVGFCIYICVKMLPIIFKEAKEIIKEMKDF